MTRLPRLRQARERPAPDHDLARAGLRLSAQLPGQLRQLPLDREATRHRARCTINIDEYANRRDLSVPGQLVQWVSMFERNKVYANQAYWDAAGNLDGNVVRTNIPNGGWWFFRWYAGTDRRDRQGHPAAGQHHRHPPGPRLPTTPHAARRRSCSAAAAGDADVVVRNVSRSVFGRTVTATVAEAAWSGYEGQHATPRVLARTKVKVAADGTVTVPLRGMHKMSAYRIVLTPGGSGTPAAASVPWSASYEAEDAAITDGKVYTQGTVSNANGYAASGTKDVGSLNQATSKVDFTVDVPRGRDVRPGDPVRQPVRRPRPPRSSRSTAATRSPSPTPPPRTGPTAPRRTSPSSSRPARHVLTLAKGDAEVTLDRIDLTARTAAALRRRTRPRSPTSAAGRRTTTPRRPGTGTGALVLRSGDKAVFDVYAPRDGYYTVVPRASAPVRLELHGAEGDGGTRPGPAAVPRRRATTASPTTAKHAAVRSLDVTGAGSTTGTLALRGRRGHPRRRRQARRLRATPRPAPTSAGSATARPAPPSSPWTPPGPAATCWSSTTRNNERRDNGHSYNTDIMSRTADITVGHGDAPEGHVQEHLGLGRLLDAGRPRRPEEGRQQGDLRQRERVGPEHRPDRTGPGHRLGLTGSRPPADAPLAGTRVVPGPVRPGQARSTSARSAL